MPVISTDTEERTARTRGVSRRRALALALGIALAGSGVGLAACSHTWNVESRQTPLHVWLSAPEIAQRGGSVNALVFVGAQKVIEGRVAFPQGTPHVVLPTLYTASGKKQVSVVIDGGRLSACDQVTIGAESWLQVVVRGSQVEIVHLGSEPLCPPD